MSVTQVTEKAGLSLEEAGQYLGISRAALYRLLDTGAIRSFHIGRRRLILREEIDRYIRVQVEAEDAPGR